MVESCINSPRMRKVGLDSLGVRVGNQTWDATVPQCEIFKSMFFTIQLLVGCWLVGCLVITSSYRSSLISHLVVQGKTPAINSVEDLMEQNGWSWGNPDMTGAITPFLSANPNTAMQKLYNQMQVQLSPLEQTAFW